MSKTDKRAIKDFVDRWQKAEGNEQREANSFWIELAGLLGMRQPTRHLDFERKVRGRRIDVFYEDMGVLIESKSRGVDLDKAYERGKTDGGDKRMVTPYEQAKWYADNLPRSISPRWVVVCNFDEIRIHDLNLDNPGSDYVSVRLEELPEQIHLLSFFTDSSQSRLVKEMELSVKAGEVVGNLYKALEGQYKNLESDEHEQRSLNVLVVRLVFLLYAEDAGLLQSHQAFGKYLKTVEARRMRQALIDLFSVLDTKVEDRDPYLDPELAEFPYINGGLFADKDIVIPQFTEDMKVDLVLNASIQFDWRDISPTIFGAVFESTLNPETRRAGGMHYTSIENIHKVIDPLFLDDFKADLAKIEAIKVEKSRKLKLKAFQRRLASINILDPACGSGNFLTESYTSLRKLENRVISELSDDASTVGMTFEELESPIKVSIDQFYGIEINDFAVAVAKTALWIAEEQMMEETQEILMQSLDFLPLKSNGNIVEGNALRVDWDEVLPAQQCNFIVGNPPFAGARQQKPNQKNDLIDALGGAKGAGNVDYVAAWYYKAADYMQKGTMSRCAFVSTNSICQGDQVSLVWKSLFARGVIINFAHDTFRWNSEAISKAHVFVVVVGFSFHPNEAQAKLFRHPAPDEDAVLEYVDNINAYLRAADNAFVESLAKPVSESAKPINYGSFALDDGNFTISETEYLEIEESSPKSLRYLREFIGANELINGKKRWCVWLSGLGPEEWGDDRLIAEKVNRVREWRASSNRKNTVELAKTPAVFAEIRQPTSDYLAIPTVSSEKRFYVPIGFLPCSTIASNQIYVLPDASLYDFGIVTSQVHNAWMRAVAGRLKSDYRYAAAVVYNTFPWPDATDEQRTAIESRAQAVLDARDAHLGKSLAKLYDPNKMPDNLLAAHKALDAAVEAAYGVDFNGDEERIVAHLFKLYAEKTATE